MLLIKLRVKISILKKHTHELFVYVVAGTNLAEITLLFQICWLCPIYESNYLQIRTQSMIDKQHKYFCGKLHLIKSFNMLLHILI